MNDHVTETTDPVVQSVIRKFDKRSKLGIEKYGTDLSRGDLDYKDWLIHLQDELMDAVNYIEAYIYKTEPQSMRVLTHEQVEKYTAAWAHPYDDDQVWNPITRQYYSRSEHNEQMKKYMIDAKGADTPDINRLKDDLLKLADAKKEEMDRKFNEMLRQDDLLTQQSYQEDDDNIIYQYLTPLTIFVIAICLICLMGFFLSKNPEYLSPFRG